MCTQLVTGCSHSPYHDYLKWKWRDIYNGIPDLKESLYCVWIHLVDCSPARLLCPHSPGKNMEWVTIPFSSRSSWPRDWILISWPSGRLFTISLVAQVVENRRSAGEEARSCKDSDTTGAIFAFIWNRILFSNKNNKLAAICSNMDAIGDFLWSRSRRGRQI